MPTSVTSGFSTWQSCPSTFHRTVQPWSCPAELRPPVETKTLGSVTWRERSNCRVLISVGALDRHVFRLLLSIWSVTHAHGCYQLSREEVRQWPRAAFRKLQIQRATGQLSRSLFVVTVQLVSVGERFHPRCSSRSRALSGTLFSEVVLFTVRRLK